MDEDKSIFDRIETYFISWPDGRLTFASTWGGGMSHEIVFALYATFLKLEI